MGKNILVVNVNWVGDVLFSTPFIRALREGYPDSYIACLLHPRCLEVLQDNPRINEIIIYDEEGEHESFIGKMRLVSSLRKRNFDMAFILHRSFTKALITSLAGIKERIGYPTKKRRFLLTKIVEEPDGVPHKVEYFLNVARAVGMKIRDNSYEFFVKDSHRSYIKDLLERNGIHSGDVLVTICPGGNWEPKRWPKENFARLADLLIETFGVRIAIAGAKNDIGLADEIKSLMKGEPLVACGKTSLKELGALLERSNLVVANDTGPMHIAVSVGAWTIALFGPTSPNITGPYGKGRYHVIFKAQTCDVPCYDITCSENRCMLKITVEEVLREASDMLMQNSKVKMQS